MSDASHVRRMALVASISFCLTVGASVVHAALIPGLPDAVTAYDPRDLALLPPYCKYTQDFRDKVPRGAAADDELARWRAVLGPTYNHMHHYCWGLMKANRGALMARSDLARRHYLSDAVTEFDYVIERAPADFVLLPEILSRKGESLVRLGRGSEAIVSFERAIQIKPDYWPPYAHASDLFKDLGDNAKARELLERGIASAPDSSALKRRLTDLQQAKRPKNSAQSHQP